jgi:AraC family transcriptional regulator, regulatory protein of adaptative response / DNA-3-methyladenine glycosylase II
MPGTRREQRTELPDVSVLDDREFSGVTTTGIYCRPGCAGRPKPSNVRAYASAVAAEAAGLRPCLRCRPDKEPNGPDWVGPSELVCRALRLIEDGALDQAGVDDLGRRLGVSGRHLRRLFDQQVGAAPDTVARSRRAHFARRLLDETDLPIATICFAAGFNSVRQMNRTMMDTFRYPPTQLRAKRRRGDLLPRDGGLRIRLPYRPPLAWPAMRDFLAHRTLSGVEAVDCSSYRRTVEIDGQPGAIQLRWLPREAHMEVTAHLPSLAGLIHVVAQARRICDLDANPTVIGQHLRHDHRMAPLVDDRPGLRVPGAWDPFELGVRAILGQQVSVAAGSRLAGRLVHTHGARILGFETLGLTHVFPRPEVLADRDLSPLGMPRDRAAAIQQFAARVATGTLTLDAAHGLEQLVDELCTLPGIGPWTAHYIAMRGCGEPDAFPHTDLGLRRALATSAVNPTALLAEANAWRPWRSYAAMHLWASLSESREEDAATVAGSG